MPSSGNIIHRAAGRLDALHRVDVAVLGHRGPTVEVSLLSVVRVVKILNRLRRGRWAAHDEGLDEGNVGSVQAGRLCLAGDRLPASVVLLPEG